MTANDVIWQMSGEVILMTLLGGVGTAAGRTIGAAVIVFIESCFAATGFPVPVVLDVIFIAYVLLFRAGIAGTIRKFVRR